MVILITGASHTGKTKLAQTLMEAYRIPYFSIDHLKMGLIRSGKTSLTPMSEDSALTAYLWPIVREMIKTVIENRQHLIVEGCYIPLDWAKDFEPSYRSDIRFLCLVMSEAYIRRRFCDIRTYANVIEQRLEDSDCTMESVLADNADMLERCRAHRAEYLLIDSEYDVTEERVRPQIGFPVPDGDGSAAPAQPGFFNNSRG